MFWLMLTVMFFALSIFYIPYINAKSKCYHSAVNWCHENNLKLILYDDRNDLPMLTPFFVNQTQIAAFIYVETKEGEKKGGVIVVGKIFCITFRHDIVNMHWDTDGGMARLIHPEDLSHKYKNKK